ncbi:flagellar hook-basal body complex protein FliE [bacterium]|jgi:flagellar hook-basal body complex protein FliE|nr:flagellar hook-basal body complex protein FliE [bacterium]
MNNTIETMGRIVESGNVDQFMGQSPAAAELRVNHVAEKEGLTPATAMPNGTTFSDILRDSVSKVNELQTQADTAIKEMVAGRNKNIHETMLTIERADSSLKLMMQVRNKILDAYREIMRMQV